MLSAYTVHAAAPGLSRTGNASLNADMVYLDLGLGNQRRLL